MSGSRSIVLTFSTKGAEKVRADLEALGPAGEAALRRLDAAAKSAGAGAVQAASGVDRLKGSLGGIGAQFQDIAVQAQMGTNALTIFAQQGPQIASYFGPAGAIAGAAIAFGAIAAQAALAAAGVKSLADVFKEIDEASKLVVAAAETRGRTLEVETARVNTLATAYGNMNTQALRGERVRLTLAGESLRQAGAREVGGLDSTLFGLQSGERARAGFLMSGQGRAMTADETGVFNSLKTLEDQAGITYDRINELVTGFDKLARAGGEYAGDAKRVRDALVAQTGALVELGDKARANRDALNVIDRLENGQSVGTEGREQFGPNPLSASEKADQRANEVAGRKAIADAAREQAAALRELQDIESRIYGAGGNLTPSGLIASDTGDEKQIRVIQAQLRAAKMLPEQVEKANKDAQAVATRASEQQQRQAEQTYDRIADYAGDRIADLFLNTEGGWERTMENVKRTAIATFARIAAEALLRPIVMPLVTAFQGGGGMGGVAGLAGSAAGGIGAPGTAAAGASGGPLGRYGGLLDGNLLSLGTGGSPTGGIVRFIDSNLGTGIGSALNSTAFTVGGNAQLAGQLGQFADTGMTVGTIGSSVNGVAVPWGSVVGGGLGVAAGLYGMYSGIQTGGAKGAAQVVGGAAGTVAGAATAAFGTTSAAGVAGGLSAMGVGAGAATAMGAVAAVAPYVAAIAAVVAMLLPAQKPSDRTGTALVNLGDDQTTIGGLTGARYSQENREFAGQVAQSIQNLANQIGTTYGINAQGRMLVSVGDRDGLVLRNGNENTRFEADEAGVAELIKAATRTILTENSGQLSADLRTTYNTVGAGDTDRLLQALDWTNTIYKSFKDSVDPTTQYAQALKSLHDQYDPLIAKAQEYGLAIAPIADVMNESIAKLNDASASQFNDTIAGLRTEFDLLTGGNTLNAQLGAFDRQRGNDWNSLADQIKQSGLGQEQIDIAADAFNRLRDLQRNNLINTYYQDEQTRAQQERENALASARQAEDRTLSVSGIRSSTTSEYLRAIGQDSEADVMDYRQQRTEAAVTLQRQLTDLGFGAEEAAGIMSRFAITTETTVQKMSAAATELGKTAEELAAERENRAGTAAGTISSLADYARGLRSGDASPLNGRSQYDMALRDFQAVAGAAQAGDYNSITRLQSYSDTLLSASRNVNGSGTGYVADFDRVQGVLGSIADLGADRLTASVMTQETRSQTQTLVEELQRLRSEVAAMRAENAQQLYRPARAA